MDHSLGSHISDGRMLFQQFDTLTIGSGRFVEEDDIEIAGIITGRV
jgi:hypothetical protein